MNKAALNKISYGLYIISSASGGKMNGQIANAVFQITADPPTIGISVNKQNLTHDFIRESGKFSISVLSTEAPMSFIGNFGFKCGRDIDKFAGLTHRTGDTGVPVVTDYSTAFYEVEVINEMDCGTHRFFWGELKSCDILSDAEPMTYAYYHAVKKGKAPASAPTYIAPNSENPTTNDSVKSFMKTQVET